MNVNAVTPNAAASGTSTPTPAANAQDLFLKLLVAQLKTQDPSSAMDPTQMVGQMLSMNQLDQLIQIRQIMQNLGSSAPTSTQPATRGN
jgi:flagellar basal-body rod modification protein FlgD